MRNLEESVFWEVFYRHQVERSELAHLFEVSVATITRSVGALFAKQLIRETGGTRSSRGRRPALLQVNSELAHLGGIEIDRDQITAVITNMTGDLLGRGAVPSDTINPVHRTLRDCRKALRRALADAGLRFGQISRIGVGLAGTLDIANGLCMNREGAPHWERVNLLGALQDNFNIDITLDDRARAVALAQHLLSPQNRRHRSAIHVQVGTGIGAGIFINGRMLRGATEAGGEIGHMVIDRNGPICRCGNRGCVESFATMISTAQRVREALEKGVKSSLSSRVTSPSQLTIEMIVSAARQGDPLASTALTEACEALGIGIANAVQLINPSLVVLAGKFVRASSDLFLKVVSRTIHKQCFETVTRDLDIRVEPAHKDAGAVGCALLASLDFATEFIQDALFTPRRYFHPVKNVRSAS